MTSGEVRDESSSIAPDVPTVLMRSEPLQGGQRHLLGRDAHKLQDG